MPFPIFIGQQYLKYRRGCLNLCMIYLEIPGDEMRRLPFYLATEEYAARNHAPRTGGQDIFFMWQVRPTVISAETRSLTTR